MSRKTAFAFTLLVLAACCLSYKLGSAPSALAKARPQQDGVASALTLPTAPANWAITTSVGGSGLVTATRAAGGSGVKHVATSLSFTLSVSATTAGGCSTVVFLRDGPSQTGTVLQQWFIAVHGGGGSGTCTGVACYNSTSMAISDLNVVGSANTPMTLESNGGCGTNYDSSVNLVGYDAM